MKLNTLILLRQRLLDVEIEAFGLKGRIPSVTHSDIELIKDLKDNFKELYFDNNNNVDLSTIEVGSSVNILLDLGNENKYYETSDNFIKLNQEKLISNEFYIHDLEYTHPSDTQPELIKKITGIHELIQFLEEISSMKVPSEGLKQLLFKKDNNIYPITLQFEIRDIKEKFRSSYDISSISKLVLSDIDSDVRKSLFVNEMINHLTPNNLTLDSLFLKWDIITEDFEKSFQFYLSGFSFNKIKASSEDYFNELTDRIYSLISKFSGYIFAIPVAYILILRFLEFDGSEFQKDTFLILVSVLYFIIIWWVLLNNLKSAFKTIENDIEKLQLKIKNEPSLEEIYNELQNRKVKVIPNQKNKINLVKAITVIILVLVLVAYFSIHFDIFISKFQSGK